MLAVKEEPTVRRGYRSAALAVAGLAGAVCGAGGGAGGGTAPPPAVTDEMVAELRRDLDDAQLVELTMMVAVENVRSRFNSALGLTSQGFRDRCELPATA